MKLNLINILYISNVKLMTSIRLPFLCICKKKRLFEEQNVDYDARLAHTLITN